MKVGSILQPKQSTIGIYGITNPKRCDYVIVRRIISESSIWVTAYKNGVEILSNAWVNPFFFYEKKKERFDI